MNNKKPLETGKFNNIYLYTAVPIVALMIFDCLTAELCDLLSNFRLFRLPLFKMVLNSSQSLFYYFRYPANAWNKNTYIGSNKMFIVATFLNILLLVSVTIFVYKSVILRKWVGKIKPYVFKEKHDISYSRWASLKDVSDLIVNESLSGRLVFGLFKNKLLAGEKNQSLLVIGPTQSKKTTGFCIPALLEWDGPIVATSVKTDLVDLTIGYRSNCGDVTVIDPSLQTQYPKTLWSPIPDIKSFDSAKKISSYMTLETCSQSGLEESRFWYQCASKLLAPMLYAASGFDLGMQDVITWVDTQAVDEVVRLLVELDDQKALHSFESVLLKEDRQRSSIFTTLETVLESYSNFRGDEKLFSTTDFFKGNNTLYLISPAHEQHRLKDYFSTVIKEILRQAFENVTSGQMPLDPPLLLILDEAANIAPISSLDTLASTAASNGIQIVSIFQDIAQIYSRYGNKASTIINNHRSKIVLSGLSDVDNLDKVSSLGGNILNKVNTISTDGVGNKTHTVSSQTSNLLTSSTLRQLEPGFGYLIYGHLSPAKIKLRCYFEDKHLLSKSQIQLKSN